MSQPARTADGTGHGQDPGADGENAAAVDCAYVWDSLDSEEARRLWNQLTTWVDWLRRTYQIESRIKPCWYRHRPVVEELTALMVAHKAVYMTEPDARTTYREDLTSWHTQWYRSSLDAIARLLADCVRDHCAYIAPTPEPEDPAREKYITADIDQRRPPATATPAPASLSMRQMSDLTFDGEAEPQPAGPDGAPRVVLEGRIWQQHPDTGDWTPRPQES